ncbi:MAG: ketoacyl-ACP synthase III [Gammaproteobacteria bacterium]|nr:ketoacyl-ACP synthase III [Gammaproteobacteria bacterium]
MGKYETHAQQAVRVIGTGSCLPDEVWTNARLIEELAKRGIESSEEWISTHTGIQERRIASPAESTSTLGTQAAQHALNNAEIKAEALDLIVCATSTPDMYLPSTACLIQGALGAHNAVAFDVNAACTGFVFALATAVNYLRTGPYRTALVIGADTYSRILDWNDRTTCVFFGDGAGAVVLQVADDAPGVLGMYLGADGGKANCIHAAACGSIPSQPTDSGERSLATKFSMKGRDVFQFAVAALPDAIRRLMQQLDMSMDNIDLVISHQANINIIRHGLSAAGIPQRKAFTNLDRYGNTSAASIPIAFDEALRLKRAIAGNIVILVGFGGGLTWGSALIRM